MAQIQDVKANIEAIFGHSYSKDGWAAIRAAALIPAGKHSCTMLGEKRLWLAASIRRMKPQNQPVTSAEVSAALLACKQDLRAAIPGFMPIPEVRSLPITVQGWELPALIESYTKYLPDDNRLRDWCSKLGFAYSRNASYSASQQSALIRHWVALRVVERERRRKSAYKNLQPHLDVA